MSEGTVRRPVGALAPSPAANRQRQLIQWALMALLAVGFILSFQSTFDLLALPGLPALMLLLLALALLVTLALAAWVTRRLELVAPRQYPVLLPVTVGVALCLYITMQPDHAPALATLILPATFVALAVGALLAFRRGAARWAVVLGGQAVVAGLLVVAGFVLPVSAMSGVVLGALVVQIAALIVARGLQRLPNRPMWLGILIGLGILAASLISFQPDHSPIVSILVLPGVFVALSIAAVTSYQSGIRAWPWLWTLQIVAAALVVAFLAWLNPGFISEALALSLLAIIASLVVALILAGRLAVSPQARSLTPLLFVTIALAFSVLCLKIQVEPLPWLLLGLLVVAWRSRDLPRLRLRSREVPGQSAMFVAIALFVLLFPALDSNLVRPLFNRDFIGEAIPTLIFILLALGLNIVVGFAGLLDLGYAAFFAIGAYTGALLTSTRSPLYPLPFVEWSAGINQFLTQITNGLIQPDTINITFWIPFVLSFFVAAAFGVILGAPTLRLRGDYLAIVTLGFGEIVPVLFRNAEGLTNGEKGLSPVARPWLPFIGELSFERGPWYYAVLFLGIITLWGIIRLRDSRLGRAWMAMREDEIAASSMGVNLVRTKLFAFGLGAAFSGTAGSLYAGYVQFVAPSSFQFDVSVIVLCMVILGGLGNVWGVIVGGLLIQVFDRIIARDASGWFQSLGQATGIDFLAQIDLTRARFLFFGLALVILMIVRPEGLFPSARRKAELHPESEDVAVRETQSLYAVEQE